MAFVLSLAMLACGTDESGAPEGEAQQPQSSPEIREPKAGETFTIGFYNMENLFDTKDDPDTYDEDFLPSNQEKPWTVERYNTKKQNLAEVVAKFGDEDGPELLGVCEVENQQVLEELVAEESLKGRNYGIVHRESSDGRGIDNALLYKKDCFKPTKVTSHKLTFPSEPNYDSRDIFVVHGEFFGKPIVLIVNHWHSRSGGREKSEPRRLVAASKVKAVLKDLLAESPDTPIFVMGDFNDEPTNKSLSRIGAVGPKVFKGEEGQLLSAMYELDQQGKGSYKYRDNWNMLDQVILSSGLTDGQGLEYVEGSATVFDPEWLRQQKPEKYKGSPLRTFGGRKYLGGYSDHFPVYVKVELVEE